MLDIRHIRGQSRRRPPGSVRAGFTLLEVMFATVILAGCVMAISQAVVSAQMTTFQALHEVRAMSLSEALIEEILSHPYADPDGASNPGPESGENGRQQFDNADDYHGYQEAIGAVVDLAGVLYPVEYQRFSRSVTAVYGSQNVPGFPAPVAGLTVTVTVSDVSGRTWPVTRFIPEPAQ